MTHKCLYCYQTTEGRQDFHQKCSVEFFGTPIPPVIEYSLDQMDELARSVVERSVAVPGVQPIILPEDAEEMALTVAGKKKKLRRAHFEQLGKGMELTDRQIHASFNRMIRNKTKALDWIDRSFLSERMKNLYRQTLEARYQQLDLSGTK